MKFILIIDIFYPPGEPTLPHLLRYRVFAVKYHSFIPCALHLQKPLLVNNPGKARIRSVYPKTCRGKDEAKGMDTGKSLPVLTTLSSRFSRGTMPALFRMAFSGIYPSPCQFLTWTIHKKYQLVNYLG